MIDKQQWESEQHWELEWWVGSPVTEGHPEGLVTCNWFAEEAKQITYFHRMGMPSGVGRGTWPEWNLFGKNVLDIGGGPTSALLKCVNRGGFCTVVDPCDYPQWALDRYEYMHIDYVKLPGEEIGNRFHPWFDEAWIYNCLQHTYDPKKIVENARKLAKVVRVFEWIEAGVMPGHPQNLHAAELDDWFGGIGTVEDMRVKPENGCDWISYYGVFNGNS